MKKGQIGLGSIMIVFITILIGVIFVQVIAQSVGDSVNTVTLENASIITTVVDNTPQYLTQYRALSDVVIYNATGDQIIGATNYTITNNVVRNGALTVNVTPLTVPAGEQYAWLVSGTAQPLTYIPDSGARSLAGLITIFFTLAIVVVAISPTIKESLGYS